MAQQVEHVLGKDEVTGSSPVSSSKKTTIFGGFFLYFITKYRHCQIHWKIKGTIADNCRHF